MTTTLERAQAITIKGNPFTLVGPQLKVGDKAPNFRLINKDGQTKTLADYAGRAKVISVVFSLDTGICDQQTRTFNVALAQLSGDPAILTVSMDLPQAQARFCSTAGIDKVEVLSDHFDANFGLSYGLLIKEKRMLGRAVFVVDKNDNITYADYLPEVASAPDHEKALAALKAVL